jgi:methylglutaconyl-CoA hydratase
VRIEAAGKSFSAGADLNWMRRAADYGEAENVADAKAMGEMLRRLDTLPMPTVALVQGAAYAGGVGLIAACDVAVAVKDAMFGVSEVRLGLIPSVILPYVIGAMGARAARRYAASGARFDAAEAHRIGLVHEVVDDADALAATAAGIVEQFLAAAPGAVAEAKRNIRAVAGRPIDDALVDETARRIAARRTTDEAREGIAAFLEKRKPSWRA